METEQEENNKKRKIDDLPQKQSIEAVEKSNVFGDMKISPTDFLNSKNSRMKCTKCGQRRKYFCYDCYEILGDDIEKVPQLQLEVRVDM